MDIKTECDSICSSSGKSGNSGMVTDGGSSPVVSKEIFFVFWSLYSVTNQCIFFSQNYIEHKGTKT